MYCKCLINIPEIGVVIGDPLFVQPDLPGNQVKIEYFNTNIIISRKDVTPIQRYEWEELHSQRKKES